MKRLSCVITETAPRLDAASEEAAIEAIQRGDRHVFAQWVRRHSRWVRGLVYAVLGRRDRVDDVAQQVWSTAWQRVGELRDTSRWRPWLYRLARNAALDAGRETTRRRELAREWSDQVRRRESPDSTDVHLVNDETHSEILTAIEALPAIYREPFVLRHLQGWSYRQIAEAMDMPVDTVETRLVRAMRQLRDALQGEGV